MKILAEINPITHLIADTDVTEILINSDQIILYEKFGQLQSSDITFSSPLHYFQSIEKITEACSTYLNREKPFIETQLGDWRLTLIYNELGGEFPLLSLRRRSNTQWTLQKLLKTNWCQPTEFEYLKKAVLDKKTILVVGATSSGKTTILQALLNAIAPFDRALILEDTKELYAPNTPSTSLTTRPHINELIGAIDLTQLLARALRLRPDRLVVGEVRGAEAYALLLALSTGHTGSMSTLHARSSSEALIRLEMLIQLGAPEWNLLSIRRLILFTIDLVVVVEKNKGIRQLKELTKIHSVEDMGLTTEKIYFRN